MNVGIFIDVNNQFYFTNKKWEGRKLNYQKYMDKAAEYGKIVRAIAYGTHVDNAAVKFISALQHLGYEPKYRAVEKNMWYSWDVGMAVDMIRLCEKLDVIILGNSNNQMTHAINFLKDKGIKVIVVGSCVTNEIKETCNQWVEINEEYLEEKLENVNEII